MAKRKIAGLRILLTGASSGIGRELALQLAAQQGRVMVTARREDRLRQLAAQTGDSAQLSWRAGDITDVEFRQQLVVETVQELGGLDCLINNAGVGAIGPFADASPQRLRDVMEVNFFAPAELIRLSLPHLRQTANSAIVNIGSVLGHRAVPDKSEYCASKFAMHGFSDALRAELSSEGIDVVHISPSTTESEFFDHVVETQDALRGLTRKAMPAKKVAQITISALKKGAHDRILSIGGKMLVWLDRRWPWLADKLVARFARQTPKTDPSPEEERKS